MMRQSTGKSTGWPFILLSGGSGAFENATGSSAGDLGPVGALAAAGAGPPLFFGDEGAEDQMSFDECSPLRPSFGSDYANKSRAFRTIRTLLRCRIDQQNADRAAKAAAGGRLQTF